jgi:Tfp pilus assembly protein PilF
MTPSSSEPPACVRSRHETRSWLARVGRVATAGALAFAVAGCGASRGAGAAPSTDQRSLAEYDLGRDAFQNGRLREALDHVQKALELDSDNAEAAYLGAVVLLGFCAKDERSTDCRYPDAEKLARKALDASPDMRDAKNTLGVILVHEKKYADAITVLKPLANDILYASPEKSWGNLGWAYLEMGRIDEAIDALRRSVASQPLFCVGQYRLGLAFEKKGELSAARDAYSKAVDTDAPECKRLQEAFGARARVAEKLGRNDEARADLERCREIASTSPLGQRCAAQLGTMQ